MRIGRNSEGVERSHPRKAIKHSGRIRYMEDEVVLLAIWRGVGLYDTPEGEGEDEGDGNIPTFTAFKSFYLHSVALFRVAA